MKEKRDSFQLEIRLKNEKKQLVWFPRLLVYCKYITFTNHTKSAGPMQILCIKSPTFPHNFKGHASNELNLNGVVWQHCTT